MVYDDSSDYGDMICDEYDEHNNPMNPPSPTGYYIYKIVGGALDQMKEMTSMFLNDYSVLSADSRSLDYFWGLSYNMPRPTIGESERLLSDDEYRIYLYIRNSQLITRQNLEVNLGKCFNNDDDKKIYFTYLERGLENVDHPHYMAQITDTSNLSKKADDTSGHFITNYKENKQNAELIRGVLSSQSESQLICNIPHPSNGGNWDPQFLEFLEQYISIKGNVKLKEANT